MFNSDDWPENPIRLSLFLSGAPKAWVSYHLRDRVGWGSGTADHTDHTAKNQPLRAHLKFTIISQLGRLLTSKVWKETWNPSQRFILKPKLKVTTWIFQHTCLHYPPWLATTQWAWNRVTVASASKQPASARYYTLVSLAGRGTVKHVLCDRDFISEIFTFG